MAYSFKMNRESVELVVNTLSDNKHKMNDWEQKFITSIKQHYITENKFMSDKQYEILSRLWEKY